MSIEQVKRLVGNGYNEVVLTGVDMTSYGPDLPGNLRLGKLVKTVLKEVPDLQRLRLSSINSIEADEDLMEALATEKRHDAASASVAAVGRQHDPEANETPPFARELHRVLRECPPIRPDIVFGADIIAGFPTETDEMFENSVRIVEECGLTHLHVFPFSPREGTPAARMPQVNRQVVKARAARLRAAGDAAYRRHLQSLVGTAQKILIEREGIGRTEGFTLVGVDGGTPGQIIERTISGHDGDKLLASDSGNQRAA